MPTGARGNASHDLCRCGNWKRTKNKQCAECRGYGKGRHVMPSGYVRVWAPNHPGRNSDGYILEHRMVLLDAGYELEPGQHVHHVNGNKTDNRLANLEIKSAQDHAGDHIRERGFIENQYGVHELRAGREPEIRACATCGAAFVPWTARGKYCSRNCSNRRAR